MAWDTSVENAITGASQKWGVDPNLLKTFAKIESGGRPTARTGSYKGLFQLSDREFGKYGGGNIYDPNANANAAAQKLAREAQGFKAKYGRDPQPSDLYMIHQQGEGGYGAHVANPGAPAWQNMYSTAEGRQKGPGWAKQAIWGNVPSDVRAQYPGGVDSLTSQQFLELWAQKVARMGGGNAPASAHMAGNAINQVANGAPQPMAGPIGGAPVQGGPVPLTPPSQRQSKLADLLMAQAAGADVKGWGDALRAMGGAALGYSMGNKADTQQQAYQGKLAQALMGANDVNSMAGVLMQSGDPELMRAGISAKVSANAPKALPNDIQEYQFAMQQNKQLGRPEIPYADWIKEVKAKQADSGYGTTPVPYKLPDGRIVYTQMSKAGGRKDVELPEGASWLPGVDLKDTGTEFVPVSKKTGEVAGAAIPKDIAGKEAAEAVGKQAGAAQATLPSMKTTMDDAFRTIDELRKHPGRETGTGLSSKLDPRNYFAGSDATDFAITNRKAKAKSFMAAREGLKGAGQVTDFEGGKGEDAIAALDAAQSDEQYLKALDDLERMMKASYDDLKAKAGMASGSQPRMATQPAATVQASKPPVRIMSKQGYDALPSGAQYVAPDGSIRTKQ